MTLTTAEVKKLRVGTQLYLVRDHDPTQRVAGGIVQSGKKKVFVTMASKTAYELKDRPGWHWVMESGADSRKLPVDHSKSGGGRRG